MPVDKVDNVWSIAVCENGGFPPKKGELQKALQEALYDFRAGADYIEAIIAKDPSIVNEPLPNGELPLHLCVREDASCVEARIEVLMRYGACLEKRDAEGLTALDHAAFLKNTQLLVKMLSLKIGKEMSEVQGQMEIIGDADNLQDILSERNGLLATDHETAPIYHAAYSGDLSSFSIKDMIDSAPNERGERPLHFAIKGGQVQLVKQIVLEMKNRGLNINELDIFKNTYLHYAAAANSKEIIEIFMEAGALLDERNNRGEIALHYAAVTGKIGLMELLIKGGTNTKIVDAGGRLPLVLFLLAAKGKDPLAVSEMQLILAGVTALYWLSIAAEKSGWKIPYLSIILPTLYVATTAFELNHLLGALNSTGKKFAALVGYLTLGYLPPVNFAYHLWRTTHLFQETASALKTAWNNVRYRKWDAVCKLAVTGTSTASAVSSTYKSYQTNKYLYDLYHLHNEYIWNTVEHIKVMISNPNMEEAFKMFEELCEEFYGFNFNDRNQNSSHNPAECKPVDVSAYTNSTCIRDATNEKCFDRILDPKLDPNCPKHAAVILTPTFNQTLFCETDDTTRHRELVREYRKLSLVVHPDKLNEEGKKICGDTCAQKVNDAKGTLDNADNRKALCK